MKSLFVKYKSVIRFILTFIIVYIFLSVCYKFYLDFSKNSVYYPDYITNLVSRQSEDILNVMGYDAHVEPHTEEPSMKLIINGKYLARIIEGCNSISIIILFVSFIMAFSGKPKTTFMYMLNAFVSLASMVEVAGPGYEANLRLARSVYIITTRPGHGPGPQRKSRVCHQESLTRPV